MNAIACLLVILIHVLSLGISSANAASWQAALIYFPSRISAFVVPLFLYTGAVKMARQFEHTEITWNVYLRYCLRRIFKIYVPYVLWVIIYYICFWKIGYVRGDIHEFFSGLFLGNLSAPFYYIVVVMQFYFLMPLWVLLVRRFPAYLAIGIGMLSMLCMQQCEYVLSLVGISFTHTDLLFPSYLIFWLAGLYVGKYYEKAASVLLQRRGQLLCAVLIVFCAALAYLQYSRDVYFSNLNAIKIVADLFSIALLHHICLRLQDAPERIRRLLEKLYQSSFFVYLSHCLFLTLATEFLLRRGIRSLSVLLPVRFLVSYSVPFVLYALWHAVTKKRKPLDR